MIYKINVTYYKLKWIKINSYLYFKSKIIKKNNKTKICNFKMKLNNTNKFKQKRIINTKSL